MKRSGSDRCDRILYILINDSIGYHNIGRIRVIGLTAYNAYLVAVELVPKAVYPDIVTINSFKNLFQILAASVL